MVDETQDIQGSGSERYEDGSGTGRYGHSDWTQVRMDETGFPVGLGTYHPTDKPAGSLVEPDPEPHTFAKDRPLSEDAKLAQALDEKYPDPQDRINAHQAANQPGDRFKK